MPENPLIYLSDPYRHEHESTCIEIDTASTPYHSLILDSTIFYPLGGGQPADQGTIEFPSLGIIVPIHNVRLGKDGRVRHETKLDLSSLEENMKACCTRSKINVERRKKHMDWHTAGHIVDFSLYMMGLTPSILIPYKGDHSKKCMITYQGTIGENPSSYIQEIQAKVSNLQKTAVFSWDYISLEEMKKRAIYLQPNLPSNKPLRALTLEGVGTVADGGTILKTGKEIDGEIYVTDITEEEGMTYVFYTVSRSISS